MNLSQMLPFFVLEMVRHQIYPERGGSGCMGGHPSRTARRKALVRRRNARTRRSATRDERTADTRGERPQSDAKSAGRGGRDDRRRHGEESKRSGDRCRKAPGRQAKRSQSGWRPERRGEVQRAAEGRTEDQRPRPEPSPPEPPERRPILSLPSLRKTSDVAL